MLQRVLTLLASIGLSLFAYGLAPGGTFQTITIDGATADWAGVPLAFSDPDDNDAGSVDWADVYIANDNDYLYVRFTLHEAAEASSFTSNYYIDGDNVDATGFHVFGSPDFGSSILIQSGVGFQQAEGGFNEGGLAASAVSFAPLFAGPGVDYEFRVDRNVTGVSGTFAGQSLITANTVQLQLQTDEGSADVAPDLINGIEYTFAVPEPGSLCLLVLGTVWFFLRRR